jgi:hypothetical protein
LLASEAIFLEGLHLVANGGFAIQIDKGDKKVDASSDRSTNALIARLKIQVFESHPIRQSREAIIRVF